MPMRRCSREGTGVMAGRNHGYNPVSDWAAKGMDLLGIRAAIPESFERIDSSNHLGRSCCRLSSRPAPRSGRWR